MVKPELGNKRVCVSCGTKFYDLGRTPAVCPKCDTEQPAEQPRVRRIVPAAPGGSSGNQRICFTRDTLDSEISGAINRVIERHAKEISDSLKKASGESM